MYHSESGASASGPQGNQLASSAAETVTRVSPEDKLPEPKVQSSAILPRLCKPACLKALVVFIGSSSDRLGERNQAAKTFFILFTLVTYIANLYPPLPSVHVDILSVRHDAFLGV